MVWPSGTAPDTSCCGSPDAVPKTHETTCGWATIAQYVTQNYPLRDFSTVKALLFIKLCLVMNVIKNMHKCEPNLISNKLYNVLIIWMPWCGYSIMPTCRINPNKNQGVISDINQVGIQCSIHCVPKYNNNNDNTESSKSPCAVPIGSKRSE